jgi:hypothetical protein
MQMKAAIPPPLNRREAVGRHAGHNWIFMPETIQAGASIRRLDLAGVVIGTLLISLAHHPIPASEEHWHNVFQHRRLVVRYERYADNFLGMLHLGCCLILMRHLRDAFLEVFLSSKNQTW